MTDSYWPIIYVRGYAMTRGEIDATAADPFCGFNLGSTVLRATANPRETRKFIFESPVVRLQAEHGYCDVYEDGIDIADPEWDAPVSRRSIIIHRYYDEASTLLGTGTTPDMATMARRLSDLVLKVRDCVCRDPASGIAREDFRCYLVAHSMGGLVCRAFLQNPANGSDEARAMVDKLFTYATPHNGIDVGGVNVPGWLTTMDLNNFNRATMAKYLDVEEHFARTGRVDWIPEDRYGSDRVFCMIGTNRSDYEAAAGASRTFVGHGSDGLVRIGNASVWGVMPDGEFSAESATAYAYRAHSGTFGIVNSEESYQNLTRFLFGNLRVDVYVEIENVRVPEGLAAADAAGQVEALYRFEFQAAPRGKRWLLTRRTAEEDSAACRSHSRLRAGGDHSSRRIYLSSLFLASRAKVDPDDPSLSYRADLGVRTPDYEVNRKFWPNRHYEGSYLFRDAVALRIVPPSEGTGWSVEYDWESDEVGQATRPIEADETRDGKAIVRIPFATRDRTAPKGPAIGGMLVFEVTEWNV